MANKLTAQNYYSTEMNRKYFSVSQFKTFMDCEARAMAELNGEWEQEKTTALLVGSYVDAWFEGTLDEFKVNNPELFKRDGSLKSDFVQAEEIIERVSQDEMFMKYMSGKKQVIKTGKIAGYPFKIKMDSFHDNKVIVDLKVMRDFEPKYIEGEGKLNFIEAWRYDWQGACYQAIEGNNLPFVIAGATKQKDAIDIGLFQIPQSKLNSALKIVEYHLPHFADVKSGLTEPIRCEKCAYCRSTKKLNKLIILEDENE